LSFPIDRESHEGGEWVQRWEEQTPAALRMGGFSGLQSLAIFPVELWTLKGETHGQYFHFLGFINPLVTVHRYSRVQRPQLN